MLGFECPLIPWKLGRIELKMITSFFWISIFIWCIYWTPMARCEAKDARGLVLVVVGSNLNYRLWVFLHPRRHFLFWDPPPAVSLPFPTHKPHSPSPLKTHFILQMDQTEKSRQLGHCSSLLWNRHNFLQLPRMCRNSTWSRCQVVPGQPLPQQLRLAWQPPTQIFCCDDPWRWSSYECWYHFFNI